MRPVPEPAQEGAFEKLLGNGDRIAGAQAERVEPTGATLREHTAVSADDERLAGVRVARRAAGVAEVVGDAESWLVEEGVLVVDRAENVDGRGAGRDDEAVAVFERDFHELAEGAVARVEVEDNASGGLDVAELVDKTALGVQAGRQGGGFFGRVRRAQPQARPNARSRPRDRG